MANNELSKHWHDVSNQYDTQGKGKTEFLEAIEQGANVNEVGHRGKVPLHNAHYTGDIEALLVRGADVNAQCEDGRTPLHHASVHKADMLLAHGADVNAVDKLGNTPLHYSQMNDKAEVLLKHGANALQKNSDGLTPREYQVKEWGMSASDDIHATMAKAEQVQGAAASRKALLEGLDKPFVACDHGEQQTQHAQRRM